MSRTVMCKHSQTKCLGTKSEFKGAAVYRQVGFIQGVPGGNVNILGGHSIGHSKQESVYVHVSCSEQFPR